MFIFQMQKMQSLSPIKDQLRSLLEREDRFDTLQNSRVVKQTKSVSPTLLQSTELNLTSETRDVAAQWLHEVVIDSKSPLDIFLLAVTLMDKFLDISTSVTKTQVQLLASACLLIATKLRISSGKVLSESQIIAYSDDSIEHKELKVRNAREKV